MTIRINTTAAIVTKVFLSSLCIPANAQVCENQAYEYLQRFSAVTSRNLYNCLSSELGIESSETLKTPEADTWIGPSQQGTMTPVQGPPKKPTNSSDQFQEKLPSEDELLDIYRNPTGEFNGGSWG